MWNSVKKKDHILIYAIKNSLRLLDLWKPSIKQPDRPVHFTWWGFGFDLWLCLQRFTLTFVVNGGHSKAVSSALDEFTDVVSQGILIHVRHFGPLHFLRVVFLNEVSLNGWSTVRFRWLPWQRDTIFDDIGDFERSNRSWRFACFCECSLVMCQKK